LSCFFRKNRSKKQAGESATDHLMQNIVLLKCLLIRSGSGVLLYIPIKINFDMTSAVRINLLSFLTIIFLLCPLQGEEIDDLNQELKELDRQQSSIVQRRKEIEERRKVLSSPEMKNPIKGIVKSSSHKTSANLAYYWDNRDFTTLNLLTSTTGLPYDFSIWGFIDLHGAHKSSSTDLSRYFIEYRLNRKIDRDWVGGLEGLGFQTEFNDSESPSNNLLRFGLTYRHSLPEFFGQEGWLQWRGFPYETDGSGQQASVIYFLPLYERVWISGFADINFRESQKNIWVIEPQLSYKFSERFSLLLEYRYNGFEDINPTVQGEGVALGVEISF